MRPIRAIKAYSRHADARERFAERMSEALGVLTWESRVEVGRIVDGRVPERRTDQDITLFKSLGIALEDIATAMRVYELAKQRGVGEPIAFWQSVPRA